MFYSECIAKHSLSLHHTLNQILSWAVNERTLARFSTGNSNLLHDQRKSLKVGESMGWHPILVSWRHICSSTRGSVFHDSIFTLCVDVIWDSFGVQRLWWAWVLFKAAWMGNPNWLWSWFGQLLKQPQNKSRKELRGSGIACPLIAQMLTHLLPNDNLGRYKANSQPWIGMDVNISLNNAIQING